MASYAKLASIFSIFFVSTYAVHFPGLDVLRPFSTPAAQEKAVFDLIGRVFGTQYQKHLNLTVDPTLAGDSDIVIIDRGPGETIKVTGASGVSVAWGVHQYLRNCCAIHISWDGNQVNLPAVLPHPAVRETRHSIGRFRYYANVCTFSYSFVWWDWAEWEKHLDWMALNGINLPLASVGMEAIWKRVYIKMGLSQADVDAYFTGPAFLAWHRMGNLKAWGGPLSDNWHATQVDLQHKILGRMVDLGMIPVLPTFAGHAPDAFQRLYPNANFSTLHWLSFNCTYGCIQLVEPTDPLFQKIGTAFMTEMKQEYGLYHAYSADPFNEMSPRSYDQGYMEAVGKAIYKPMTQVDPEAVWVMQAWMFVGDDGWRKHNETTKRFLTSVPLGKLLLLDLFSEQHPVYQMFYSFYGQPFIWNVLHNFGGVLGLFGSVTKIDQSLWTAMYYPNSTLVGAGLTMEGIYQNYPIYQFALDRAWAPRRRIINQTNWISHYARQRYGGYDEYLRNAWRILWKTVYDEPSSLTWDKTKNESTSSSISLRFAQTSALTKRPSLNMDSSPVYDPQSLCTAWKYFIHSADAHSNSSLFRLDLVDLTREVLMYLAGQNYRLLNRAYYKKDIKTVAESGTTIVSILGDLDCILSTHEHFLFGRWIKQARAKGNNSGESDLYEYNMRNQITLWGPNGEIVDYARKEWAGVVSHFIKPRWLLFTNMLLNSLVPGGSAFSQSTYNNLVLNTMERPFTFQVNVFPDRPVGDSVEIAKKMYQKYAASCHV